MLGFETPTYVEPSNTPGVSHVPLKFDMPMDDWRTIKRADLIFEGVPHIGESYEVRVFFNNPKADAATERTAANRYAGRFVVFGHGDCFGAAGHCHATDVVARDPMQTSAPHLQHPARPHTRLLTVTTALDRIMKRYKRGLHTVTLVTTTKSPRQEDRGPKDGLFHCERLSIQVYA